ncbi:hypothetical protein EXIGLDRAFT_783826, partial [Exidia glandulosa HHB12029]
SEAEKKARKKAKKDAAKEKKDGTKAGGEEETQQQPSKYDDPEGAKLLASATPLDEAAKMRWVDEGVRRCRG